MTGGFAKINRRLHAGHLFATTSTIGPYISAGLFAFWFRLKVPLMNSLTDTGLQQDIQISIGHQLNADLLDQMFLMRARAFKVRRRWSVEIKDGLERDGFDDCAPQYLLAHADGILLGSLRILPSTGPTMIADVFPEILDGQNIPTGPHIAEVSRLCIDPLVIMDKTDTATPNAITRAMLSALFAKMGHTQVQTLVAVHDLMVERILRQAGWPPQRLGRPICTDTGLTTVASTFAVPKLPKAAVVAASSGFSLPQISPL